MKMVITFIEELASPFAKFVTTVLNNYCITEEIKGESIVLNGKTFTLANFETVSYLKDESITWEAVPTKELLEAIKKHFGDKLTPYNFSDIKVDQNTGKIIDGILEFKAVNESSLIEKTLASQLATTGIFTLLHLVFTGVKSLITKSPKWKDDINEVVQSSLKKIFSSCVVSIFGAFVPSLSGAVAAFHLSTFVQYIVQTYLPDFNPLNAVVQASVSFVSRQLHQLQKASLAIVPRATPFVKFGVPAIASFAVTLSLNLALDAFRGRIRGKEAKTRIVTRVADAAISSTLSLSLGVAVQIMCPVPIVGLFVGGVIGQIIADRFKLTK